MYQVRRNNRVLKSLGVFDDYEKARQALRKYIRKMVAAGKASMYEFCLFKGFFYRNSLNFTNAGFSIRRVQ